MNRETAMNDQTLPTEADWAFAKVEVVKKFDQAGGLLWVGLHKVLEKGGVVHESTMWLTPGQLRGVVIEELM